MIDLRHEFDRLTAIWSPHVVARVDDHLVKVARLAGDFVWHAHADEDELFLVVSGRLTIEFEDRPHVRLAPGQLAVVPRGVRHRPVASEPVEIVLVERAQTAHTGDVVVPGLTRSLEEQTSRA